MEKFELGEITNLKSEPDINVVICEDHSSANYYVCQWLNRDGDLQTGNIYAVALNKKTIEQERRGVVL